MKYFTLILMAGLLFSCGSGGADASKSDGITNETLETIFARKSVRDFVPGKTIELDTLKTILKAGMAAPSGMNRQPWNLMLVTGEPYMSDLADSLPNLKMLKSASAAIVVVGNPELSQLWYLDCAAVAQNILLAVESMGLGAVWTAGYPHTDRMEPISAALDIPEPWLPLCLIPIGYPNGEFQPKDKWDPDRVHYFSW